MRLRLPIPPKPTPPKNDPIAAIKAQKAANAKIIAMKEAEAMANKAIAGKGMQQPSTAGSGIGGSRYDFEPKASPMPVPNKPSYSGPAPELKANTGEEALLNSKSLPPKVMKKGGSVGSASKRADGCAQRGKTKGRML